MIRRYQHRLTTKAEAICAALMTVVGHALVLIIMGHSMDSGRGAAEQGQGGAMEVTFVMLPKAAVPHAPSVQPTVHLAPEAIAMLAPLPQPTQSERGMDQASDEDVRQQAAMKEGQGRPFPQDSLKIQYEAAIRAAIERKWQSLPPPRLSKNCTLHFTQTPGGAVTSALARNCDLSEEQRLGLEAAVLMAQPLPYQGYESVFETELEISF